jgi:hypothetical protein
VKKVTLLELNEHELNLQEPMVGSELLIRAGSVSRSARAAAEISRVEVAKKVRREPRALAGARGRKK